MLIKTFRGLDSANKNRDFVHLRCDVCSTEFSRQDRMRKAGGDYCSSKCRAVHDGSAISLTCSHCDVPFTRAKSRAMSPKSGKNFCSRVCKEAAQKYMKEIMPSHYYTGDGSSTYADRAYRELPNVCNRCGYSQKIGLCVHHIDHNRENNELNNLEILCGTCHLIHHRLHGY